MLEVSQSQDFSLCTQQVVLQTGCQETFVPGSNIVGTSLLSSISPGLSETFRSLCLLLNVIYISVLVNVEAGT